MEKPYFKWVILCPHDIISLLLCWYKSNQSTISKQSISILCGAVNTLFNAILWSDMKTMEHYDLNP